MKIIIKSLLLSLTLIGISLTSASAQNTAIVLNGSVSYNLRFVSSARGTTVTYSEAKISNLTNYNQSQSSENLTAALTLMKSCYNPSARGQKAYYIAKQKIGSIAPYTYIPTVSFTGGRFTVAPGKYAVNLLVYSKSGVWASYCFKKKIRLVK